jgi:hypothetical protein
MTLGTADETGRHWVLDPSDCRFAVVLDEPAS